MINQSSCENGSVTADAEHVSRRTILKTGAAASAAGLTGLAGCSGGGGGDDTISFGAIHLLSGFASVYGESAQLGYEMAREEINADGGIDGREIEPLIYRDSEADGPTGIEAARSLVEEENVDGLIGLDSSGVALQVAPFAKQLQTPLMITHAATPFVTATEGEDAVGNDYVFRDGVNLSQNVYGAAKVSEGLDGTSWTTIGPNYAFGTQSWQYFKAFTQGLDLGYDYLDGAAAFPGLGASDYTPQINKVLNGDPDGVVVSLWGSDLVTFINQARETAFFDEVDHVLLTLGAATDALRPLGSDIPDGLWAGTRYWFETPDSEANGTFVEKFVEQNDRQPSYNAQNAYVGLYLYKQAIEANGSTAADDVTSGFEGASMDAPVGELSINEASNQATLPAVWGQTSYSEDLGLSRLDPVERIETPPETLRSLLEDSDYPAGV
jgi:branched-chain amino acid transport system substrate-binding protein